MTTWKINLVRTVSGLQFVTSDKLVEVSTFSSNTEGLYITSHSGEHKEFIPMQQIEYIQFNKEEQE